MIGLQFFQTTVTSFQRDRAGARRCSGFLDRQTDRLGRDRVRFGRSHRGASFFRSSLKNLFNSALLIRPAKPSNLPSRAISVATRIKACVATRASEPPTL